MEMRWEPTDLDSVQIKEKILIQQLNCLEKLIYVWEGWLFGFPLEGCQFWAVICYQVIGCCKVVWLALAGMERCLWHWICEKQTVMSHCGGQRDRLAKITQSSSSSGLRHAILFS